ncbi:MAG: capsular polysaccharide biosynthesis protein [Hyphomicrobiales bacterium]
MSDELLIFSLGLWTLREELAQLTGLKPRLALLGGRNPAAVAGWGHKPTAARARRYAATHAKPYIAFEDGFLRSVRPGPGTRPLSIIMDRTGIYYDARSPSDLETLLAETEFTAQELATARELMGVLRSERLSKYNDAPLEKGPTTGARILVIDQTHGDASVAGGLADGETFGTMIAAARKENPGGRIAAKLHPETVTGAKRGYLLDHARRLGVDLIDGPVNPWALIEEAERVYTVSSQLGFEALLAGRKVTCFGVPFYSGWGLTDDRLSVPRRGRARSLVDVTAAAYLRYMRYFDPWTRRPTDPLTAVDQLKFLRDRYAANRDPMIAYGIAGWKRRRIAILLEGPHGRPRFVATARDALKLAKARSAGVVSWGRTANRDAERFRNEGIRLTTIEDGFIRSAGLGAAFAQSLSFAFDENGIYYDPSRPSDLEELLSGIELTPELRARARALRRTILDLGLTKYNIRAGPTLRYPDDRELLLVPGQVVDDEAIRLGGPPSYRAEDVVEGGMNLALLREARRRNPDAFIVYKPHPDVERLGRLGAIPPKRAKDYADDIADHAPIAALLDRASRVETLTSLAGFEALLRGKRVTAHGQPFYAGWGLTEDIHPPPRRQRRLDLDELVAGALILYPRYYDPVSRLPCPVETAVERISAERRTRHSVSDVLGEWLGRAVIAARNASR